jgi:hypothetical protein
MVTQITPAYGTYSGNSIVLDNGGLVTIQNMTPKKDANLIVLPLPTSDSASTDVLDYMGVIKNIPINGTFIGNTGSIKGFVGSMYGLVQGAQTGSSFFVNEIEGSVICKVDSFGYNWVAGDPNRITWDMKIIESSPYS